MPPVSEREEGWSAGPGLAGPPRLLPADGVCKGCRRDRKKKNVIKSLISIFITTLCVSVCLGGEGEGVRGLPCVFVRLCVCVCLCVCVSVWQGICAGARDIDGQ